MNSQSNHPDHKSKTSLEKNFMDSHANDTLSDIHIESNNELEINQTAIQTFTSFFEKQNEPQISSLDSNLSRNVPEFSMIKLFPVQNSQVYQENPILNGKNEKSQNALIKSYEKYSQKPKNTTNLKVSKPLEIEGNPSFNFLVQPSVSKKVNLPQKRESELNIAVLIVSIFFYLGLIGGIILIKFPSTFATSICLLVIPYLVYLVIALRCNSLGKELSNLKRFEEYKQTYDKMVSTRPQFRFYIYCYHYATVKASENGIPRQQMVNTHTATQNYSPQVWADESGDIAGINDVKKYVFINYERSFYFADKESEEKFKSEYKSFVQRNKKDKRQDTSSTFELPHFVDQVGFCMLGESPHSKWVFYLFTLMGMAFAYNCIMERSISRYNIKIVKRIGNPS